MPAPQSEETNEDSILEGQLAFNVASVYGLNFVQSVMLECNEKAPHEGRGNIKHTSLQQAIHKHTKYAFEYEFECECEYEDERVQVQGRVPV